MNVAPGEIGAGLPPLPAHQLVLKGRRGESWAYCPDCPGWSWAAPRRMLRSAHVRRVPGNAKTRRHARRVAAAREARRG